MTLSSAPRFASATAGALLGMLALACLCPGAAQETCNAAGDEARQGSSLMQVQRQTHQKKQGGVRHTAPRLRRSRGQQAPCSCHADDAAWTPPKPREPRCVFIDLGAADGNTFQSFLEGGFGSLANCPSNGAYEAILVEANPLFAKPLEAVQANYSGVARSLPSTAAYMCEGNTSFFLDTVDTETNYWGSSLSPNANDVIRSGRQQVTVPLVNVPRLIAESSLPEDYVILKMDIEGAEHDILPCLVQSQSAKLVDALFLEQHPVEWSLGSSDENATQRSLAALQAQGTWVPEYYSPTF